MTSKRSTTRKTNSNTINRTAKQQKVYDSLTGGSKAAYTRELKAAGDSAGIKAAVTKKFQARAIK